MQFILIPVSLGVQTAIVEFQKLSSSSKTRKCLPYCTTSCLFRSHIPQTLKKNVILNKRATGFVFLLHVKENGALQDFITIRKKKSSLTMRLYLHSV